MRHIYRTPASFLLLLPLSTSSMTMKDMQNNVSDHVPIERRSSRTRQSYHRRTKSASTDDDKASVDSTNSLRQQGMISSRPRQSNSTTPRRRRSSTRRPPEIENVNANELDNNDSGVPSVKAKASEGKENKESGSGRRSFEIHNPYVSSEVKPPARSKPPDKKMTSRQSSEIIISTNDCGNVNGNFVKSKASDGDNTTESPTETSEGTRRRSSSSEFVKPSGERYKDRSVSRSSQRNRTKSPRGRMRANSLTVKTKPSSVQNMIRVSSATASKNQDILSTVDVLDGPFLDTSSPTSASSSDIAEEEAVKTRRRRASSRGPRDILSQSSHVRSKRSRSERLSQSSHNNSTRRRDRFGQSTNEKLKASTAPAEDNTVDDCSENEESSSSEENAGQEKIGGAELRHTFEPEALLSIPSTSVAVSLLDPPPLCLHPVSQKQAILQTKSRRPRDRLSQSSHSRSRGSHGKSISQPNHNKPPRRSVSLIQSITYANWKAPAPSEDDTDEFAAEATISIEENTSNTPHQEQADTAEPTGPNHNADCLEEEAALLHELLGQAVEGNLEAPLDSPSVASSGLPLESHSEPTRHKSTYELEALLCRQATTVTGLDSPSLDLPSSVCLTHSVSQKRPSLQTRSRRPRDRLSQSSHDRSRRGSRGKSIGQFSRKKPLRRSVSSIQSITDVNWKAPDPSEDVVTDEFSVETPPSHVEENVSNAPHQEQADATKLTWLEHADTSREPTPTTSKDNSDRLEDEATLLREVLIGQAGKGIVEARLDTPLVAFYDLPLESHSEPTRHNSTSELEALLNRQSSAFTALDAPSLDPPSGCLMHPASQTKPMVQMKPGKKHQKLADLLEKGKPSVTTFSLLDVPSLAPPSVCAIPLASKASSKKKHSNYGISTGLGELLGRKPPATTFTLDASSLGDNPSVSFFQVNL